MHRIALIEDDKATSDLYSKTLRQANIEVDQFFEIEDAKKNLRLKEYDAYILDLELNHITYDGLKIVPVIQDILKSRNNKSIIPILVVSGHPPGEYKEISQNFFTAWDYIQKPVEPIKNLVSMTQRLLQFAYQQRESIGKDESINNLSFHDTNVLWKGNRVSLPMTLYKFLRCLVKEKKRVVTFNELHQLTASLETDRLKKKGNVRAHIKRLREAFQVSDLDFDAIKPIHGKGYMWTEDN